MAGAAAFLCSCGFALHYNHPELIHDAPWGLSDLLTLVGLLVAGRSAYLLWSWRRA